MSVKKISNHKDIIKEIEYWETDKIDVFYEKGSKKVRLKYEGVEVVYQGTVRDVAYIAYQCGGISSNTYTEVVS